MTKHSRVLIGAVLLALPASLLLLLPLGAQEPAAPAPPQATPAAPAKPAAPPADAPPEPEPESAGAELPPDERVSADNNLSFPVDI